MNTTKLQIKFFTIEKEVDFDPIIPVFHTWIRDHKIPGELLIDVADYAHVVDGPGIVLIGYQSDYYLDVSKGAPGLLYSRKRGFEGDIEASLRDAFGRALFTCEALEKESSLDMHFNTEFIDMRIMDRLNAPNMNSTLETIRPALNTVLSVLYPESEIAIKRTGTAKEPFTVHIECTNVASDNVTTLLHRLQP